MSRMLRVLAGLALISVIAVSGAPKAAATQVCSAQNICADPDPIAFNHVLVGQVATSAFDLTNNTGKGITVQSFVFSPPCLAPGPCLFGLVDGVFPRGVGNGIVSKWSLAFLPAAAQNYSGTLTINFQDTSLQPLVVPLSGIGTTNTGIASLSASSLNFGNVPLGSSATQNVTVTNTGTQGFNVKSVSTFEPFAVSGFTTEYNLPPGGSLPLTVTYSASSLGPATGTLNLIYDYRPANGIDLAATGTTPAGLALTSYPTLPSATVGAAYLATLQATGGTPPYTFQVTSGAVQGLKFSASTGTFSGSVASTVSPGNYSLGIQVADSSSQRKVTNATVVLPVGAATGASCNIIHVNVKKTGTPIQALNDLGTGMYLGQEGGLYPNGSNVDPAAHVSSGVTIAQGIQPLDINGNPDPNGLYVLMSLGISNTRYPFVDFVTWASADPEKNSHLQVVNGALAGATGAYLGEANSPYLNTVINYVLPFYGVTAEQVAVVWIDTADSTNPIFPTDATNLQGQMEDLVRNLHTLFPNLVLAYFGGVNYTGYAQGVSMVLPEPAAYETAFGDKWAIGDQINGVNNLNFDPNVGPVVAPWMAWGPYYWSNGLMARSDGTTWSCQDLNSDGTHPAPLTGDYKIANDLLNFFKTDPTASPWFVGSGTK